MDVLSKKSTNPSSADDRQEGQETKYKSPRRKLLAFFERSRDQWKAKCREAKASLKRLKNRMRFLEKSKETWKSRAKELEDELARSVAKQQALEREVIELKKKLPNHRKETRA